MTTLVGPCMLLAPLVAVLAILALPLWPVAIVVVGLAFLVLWPIERLLDLAGLPWIHGWSAAVGRAFMLVLRPWSYFEPPKVGTEQQQAPPSGESSPGA